MKFFVTVLQMFFLPSKYYYLLNYTGIEQDTVATRVGHKIKTKVGHVL